MEQLKPGNIYNLKNKYNNCDLTKLTCIFISKLEFNPKFIHKFISTEVLFDDIIRPCFHFYSIKNNESFYIDEEILNLYYITKI